MPQGGRGRTPVSDTNTDAYTQCHVGGWTGCSGDETYLPRAVYLSATDNQFFSGPKESGLLALIALELGVERLEDNFSGMHRFRGFAMKSYAVEDSFEIFGKEFAEEGDFILVGGHGGGGSGSYAAGAAGAE